MRNGGFIMIVDLITREQLQAINRKTLKYGLAEAEKDYFLAVATQLIYESELSKKIIFKGGTALHHCYLPQLRFSEDLDFSSKTKEITLEEVKKVLESPSFFSIKKEFVSKATIKIEKLQYEGLLGQQNSIKVEIDFIQNVILPAQTLPYQNVWGVETKAIVMDIREICAEKIRAMNDRYRYRDFYDFYLIMQRIHPNLPEIYDIMKQKEVRKPIAKENIFAHWQEAIKDKQNELGTVNYSKEVFDHDELITKELEKLDFTPLQVNSVFQKQEK